MIRLAIRRPVAVTMMYLAVAALGILAWRNLPIELLPDTTLPRLTVQAQWLGNAPEVVEAFLTAPLESEIRQVRGVQTITSTSSEGQAEIQVEFAFDTDMNFARLELSERLAALEGRMPVGARPPTVSPYVPREFEEQTSPLLRYTVTGPYTLEWLREWVEDNIAFELSQIDGVGVVDVRGGRARVLDIELDENRLRSFGLRPQDVHQRVLQLEIVREAGWVTTSTGALRTLAIRERAGSADDVRDLPLLTSDGQVIRLRDVGRVHETWEDATSHYRIDGFPALQFWIFRAPRSNAVATADAVKSRLERLEATYPSGVRAILDADQSRDIRAQLSDLRNRALVAAVIVLLVLIVFLRSLRAATIVFATVAFAVLITLNLMYFGGFTLNVLTLMGLAMGFGLVVDNAIVVLENIFRYRRRGMPAAEAAEHGARHVVLPVVAATCTTVVVVLPFVYLQGALRVFYVPLALVVGMSLIASLFVAFSFIPSLAARLLETVGTASSVHGVDEREGVTPSARASAGARAGITPSTGVGVTPTGAGPGNGVDEPEGVTPSARASAVAPPSPLAAVTPNPHARASAPPSPLAPPTPLPSTLNLSRPAAAIYHAITRAYGALVRGSLRVPYLTVALALLMLGGSYVLFDKYVTRNVLWRGLWGGDQTYIDIQILQPRGEELARTDELARYFEERLRRMPEVDRFTSRVFAQRGSIRVEFDDDIAATMIPVGIKEQLVQYSLLFGGTDVRVYGYGPSFYGGGGGTPPNYSIKILGYNYDQVRDIAEDVGRRLERFSRIREVDTNSAGQWFQRDRVTEIVVDLDRARLALHELTAQEVVDFVASTIRGRNMPGTIRVGGDEMQAQVKLQDYDRIDLHQLEETLVTGASGEAVRLGDIARIYERQTLNRVIRENQQYQRMVSYEFRGPTRLGDRVKESVVQATMLPPGYAIEDAQLWSWAADEKQQVWGVLALAIALVFMVTAALFESLRQPFCVLLTVPMALIGVFLLFFYTGASFTREAWIGVIMMGGIVVNNAILLVDHVNRLRRIDGLELADALVRGTLERVRPILMTSLTTICGLLPLVLFSESANANIWQALAYALIGGLASSTILVLTVTPSLYLLIESPRWPWREFVRPRWLCI